MKRIIKVTQDHINQGTPESCTCCPIAMALADAGFECIEVADSIKNA